MALDLTEMMLTSVLTDVMRIQDVNGTPMTPGRLVNKYISKYSFQHYVSGKIYVILSQDEVISVIGQMGLCPGQHSETDAMKIHFVTNLTTSMDTNACYSLMIIGMLLLLTSGGTLTTQEVYLNS